MPSTPNVSDLHDSPLDYPIFVGRGSCASLGDVVHEYAPAHRYVVIADATVATLHGDAIRSALAGKHIDLLTVAPGEAEKTRERWTQLTDQLFELECGRDTTIIAAGGGVVSDLAGFVAATFMRGVPMVLMPTTLLAMVDASVGGKTGVDTQYGKNMVGAFHDPKAVLIDPSLLRTLPTPVFRSGMAEILKHGIVADVAFLQRVVSALPEVVARGADASELPEIIEDSVRIKADIVAQDRRERGIRKVLNYGHTIAHALERASNYAIGHGDAVAVGMVVEARISELIGLASPGLAEMVTEFVGRATLPTSVAQLSDKLPDIKPSAHQLVELTRSDKKARGGAVRYALPWQLGEMEAANGDWSVAVADGIVERALG